MKKTFFGIIAVFLMTTGFVSPASSAKQKAACENKENCVCCPCTPDCQPGSPNFTCEPGCTCEEDCK